jgi:hypothetical protein
MRCIGWLGSELGVQGSGMLQSSDRTMLLNSSRRVGGIALGVHECEFCREGHRFEGNGEYRYYLPGGAVYCAPMMLMHYIDEHEYCPPRVFLDDMRLTGPLVWDSRAELLSEIIFDPSLDIDLRCEAVVDLANWNDVRALRAIEWALRDETLSDAAGIEIGYSLGLFLSSGLISNESVYDLPDVVRLGVDQALRSLSS